MCGSSSCYQNCTDHSGSGQRSRPTYDHTSIKHFCFTLDNDVAQLGSPNKTTWVDEKKNHNNKVIVMVKAQHLTKKNTFSPYMTVIFMDAILLIS